MTNTPLTDTLITNAGYLMADAGQTGNGAWLLEIVEKRIPISTINLRSLIHGFENSTDPRIRTACDSLSHVVSLLG